MKKFKLSKTIIWKTIAGVLVVVIGIVSLTVAADKYTDPQTYSRTIQSIDEKKATVLGVSAAIAGSATLLAAIPDDSTTPLAEELMDFSSYLVVVVCALVLEKSLLTMFGFLTFKIFVPLACVLGLIYIISLRKDFLAWALKFLAFALALVLIVPTAMRISDYIYETNQFEVVVEEMAPIEEEPVVEEDVPWYKKLWNKVEETVKAGVNQALESGKKALNEFIDAVSLFVIAYCAIPILIILLFVWLVKVLFGIKVPLPSAEDIKRWRVPFGKGAGNGHIEREELLLTE